MTDLILARATLLCARYAIHRARRTHGRIPAGLTRALRLSVARVAAMKGR